MANLVCELCGSKEIVKEGELFVCKGCGCRYTLEQAKNLIAAQQSEVQEKSNNLNNLYVLARRALESKDYEKAEAYYLQILLTEPDDWEATFYSILAGARVHAKKYPEGALTQLCERLSPIYGLIMKAFPDKRTQCEKLNEVITGVNLFIQDYSVRRGKAENRHTNRGTVYIRNLLWDCGDNIVKTFGDDEVYDKITVDLWKRGVKVAMELLDYIRKTNAQNPYYMFAEDKNAENYVAKIKHYNDKIKQKDPTYIPPQIKATKSGCYVATCVYGSYDCAEVWTLRRYRDNTLAATRSGRAFIRLYYALSPTIVKVFGKKKWFRKIFKKKLDKKVERLQKQGVESTPYKDREW